MPKQLTDLEITKGNAILEQRGILLSEWIVDLSVSKAIILARHCQSMVDPTRILIGFYTSGIFQQVSGGAIYDASQLVNFQTPSILSPIIQECGAYTLAGINSSRFVIKPTRQNGKISPKVNEMFGLLSRYVAQEFAQHISTQRDLKAVVQGLIQYGQSGLMITKALTGKIALRYLDPGTYYVLLDDETREPISYWRTQMYGYDTFARVFECDVGVDVSSKMFSGQGVLVQHVTEYSQAEKLWKEYAIVVSGQDEWVGLGQKRKNKVKFKLQNAREGEAKDLEVNGEIESGQLYLRFRDKGRIKSKFPHFKVHTLGDSIRNYGTSPIVSLLPLLGELQALLSTRGKVTVDTTTPFVLVPESLAKDVAFSVKNKQIPILTHQTAGIVVSRSSSTDPLSSQAPTPFQVTNGIQIWCQTVNTLVEMIRSHLGLSGTAYLSQETKSNVTTEEVNNRSQAFDVQITDMLDAIVDTVGTQSFEFILHGVVKDILDDKIPELEGLKPYFTDDEDNKTLDKIQWRIIREGHDYLSQYQEAAITKFQQMMNQLYQIGDPAVSFKIDNNALINAIGEACDISGVVVSDREAEAAKAKEEAAQAQAMQQQQEMQQQQQQMQQMQQAGGGGGSVQPNGMQ